MVVALRLSNDSRSSVRLVSEQSDRISAMSPMSPPTGSSNFNLSSSRPSGSYKVTIREETYSDPVVRYTLYPIELTQHDRQCMQEDASHIPGAAHIRSESSSMFSLLADVAILLVDRCYWLFDTNPFVWQTLSYPARNRNSLSSHHP